MDIGATTGAADVLGYHEYSASAMWRVSGQEADIAFDAPPVSWNVSYAYQRWRPSFLLSVWHNVETVAVSAGGSAVTQLAQERSQGLFAGVQVPWRRVRLAQSWLAGVDVDERRLPESAGVQDRSRNAIRAGWALSSSREYGYSISREDGLWMAVNLERVTPGLGADANAFSLAGDWRGYAPGFGQHHVAALRVGAASSTGDAGMTRSFSLGGSGLSSAPLVPRCLVCRPTVPARQTPYCTSAARSSDSAVPVAVAGCQWVFGMRFRKSARACRQRSALCREELTSRGDS